MNSVQLFLDELGLPWQSPMRELVDRFGVTSHPVYDWDVVQIPLQSMLAPGMIFPMYTNAFRTSSDWPPDHFSTRFWVENDAFVNIRSAGQLIAARLGPAVMQGKDNAFAWEWNAGPASIKLFAASRERQAYPTAYPSYEREPKLRTACSVSIYPGFRNSLSEQELAWVTTASVVIGVTDRNVARSLSELRRSRPYAITVQFARDPVEQCSTMLGQVSLSADRQAVIICARDFLVIPTARILRICVEKKFAARGSGGSNLLLIFADNDSDSREASIYLSEGADPDELDTVAFCLGRRLGKPVHIGTAIPDD